MPGPGPGKTPATGCRGPVRQPGECRANGCRARDHRLRRHRTGDRGRARPGHAGPGGHRTGRGEASARVHRLQRPCPAVGRARAQRRRAGLGDHRAGAAGHRAGYHPSPPASVVTGEDGHGRVTAPARRLPWPPDGSRRPGLAGRCAPLTSGCGGYARAHGTRTTTGQVAARCRRPGSPASATSRAGGRSRAREGSAPCRRHRTGRGEAPGAPAAAATAGRDRVRSGLTGLGSTGQVPVGRGRVSPASATGSRSRPGTGRALTTPPPDKAPRAGDQDPPASGSPGRPGGHGPGPTGRGGHRPVVVTRYQAGPTGPGSQRTRSRNPVTGPGSPAAEATSPGARAGLRVRAPGVRTAAAAGGVPAAGGARRGGPGRAGAGPVRTDRGSTARWVRAGPAGRHRREVGARESEDGRPAPVRPGGENTPFRVTSGTRSATACWPSVTDGGARPRSGPVRRICGRRRPDGPLATRCTGPSGSSRARRSRSRRGQTGAPGVS